MFSIHWKELITKSVMAGLLIGFAGWIYLMCENKIVGSALFSVGLISVIVLQANLYTGKIGYVNSKKTAAEAAIILVINVLTAFLVGFLFKNVIGEFSFQLRLDKSWYRILLDGVGCGMLIYLAVELYRKTNNIITIILPVVAFILAGMEHSIADAFYFGASAFSLQGLLYLFLVVIGNSVGSLLVRRLQLLYENNKK